MQPIHATYREGVLRPTEPLALPDGCEVELQIITPAPQDSPQHGQQDNDGTIEDALSRLASQLPIQEWDSLPEDLTDRLDHYLYGNHSG